ncbi:hypothetical protein R3P38DRAFT_3376996 [Favolaschia claudopus]|uniref:Uncharacterized protein n=1 Tax=Favolaschia claudopus TaxID=2862362 RepID=A0AAV9ZD56_9AGAR
MQCRFLLAFAVSLFTLTLTVSAAPIPIPIPNNLQTQPKREIVLSEPPPFVGMSDVARAVEPEPEPEPASEPQRETEEARGCRMYACIWSPFVSLSQALVYTIRYLVSGGTYFTSMD